MPQDPRTGEVFLRIVGKRTQRCLGELPDLSTRQAMDKMLAYRTRAPKGVFLYRNHDEMQADRLRWTVEAIVERARNA